MHIFLIADTHFDDDNIRRYENRPFESITEMNKKLIENWNSVVTQNDEVYVLGDFGAEGNEKRVFIKVEWKKILSKGKS